MSFDGFFLFLKLLQVIHNKTNSQREPSYSVGTLSFQNRREGRITNKFKVFFQNTKSHRPLN